MISIYSFSVFIYMMLIRLASLWNEKARQWINGRKHWKDILSRQLRYDKPIIWVHAASLGEFEQGRPIIEKLKSDYPQYKLLLTFFSPSGYEVRKTYDKADYIAYLPPDTKRNARCFLELVQPVQIIFIKYELWYHYIMAAHRKNIPFYVASAIFRPRQLFFKWYGRWYLKALQTINHFFVQNDTSKRLLNAHGIEQVTVSGDTRYDRVFENAQQVTENAIAASFTGNHDTIIAGSTWPPDENLVIRYINEHPGIRLILAPHEINIDHISHIERKLKVPFIRYSQANKENVKKHSVLIIDNVGMLASLYQYAVVAYIGGGFGKGIHNILEAVTFGLPVIVGPNYHKFQEAHELVALRGAHAIHNYDGLKAIIDNYFKNREQLSVQHKRNKAFIEHRTGATQIILKHILP